MHISSRLQCENESEKINKYVNHVRKLKNLWSMKMTLISVVIGALLKVLKDIEKILRKPRKDIEIS